ncbi:MAG: transglutaminase domain-containing protein [Ginsengibacter sp.]
MKWLPTLILIFTCVQSARAQNQFAAERVYVNIPSSQTGTSAGIAAYINAHYQSGEEKISAIYSWLTANIKYDADSIHYVILDEDNEERVSFALRRKRGVCENFAAVFTDVANKCGINSFVVEGLIKQGGTVYRSGHVWCIAYVNNKWGLYDPTWDAGRLGRAGLNSQFNYFNVSPEEFIQTHLPFDPVFQLLNYPINYNDFARGNTSQNNKGKYFNYKDSLEAIKNNDRLTKYANEISRIESAGWPSSKIETKLKRIRFQVEVLSQDSDAELYNSAVSDYNSAINSLNNFIAYRNNQFQPGKLNEEVQKIFQNVSLLLSSANLKLNKIDSSTATLQLNTSDIQKKLKDLEINLKKQEAFFKNYTAEAVREKNKNLY